MECSVAFQSMPIRVIFTRHPSNALRQFQQVEIFKELHLTPNTVNNKNVVSDRTKTGEHHIFNWIVYW